ncbi:EAL and GGDEF domain-containing protein [Paraburkholderia phosphatilytica]|uniref:sensor domain-containing protein n=1 Tax=Paraburkholderia phosphatilytica TaxID=2282883 RepID=UPI000E470373|nr:EAL domain-containing protein [Paraburkholderia phosphatilytica]
MLQVSSEARRFAARFRTLFITALVSVIAVGVIVTATFEVFAARARADLELMHALSIKDQVQKLQALHVAANADFLKGLGTTRWESYAWPIARAGMAARFYDGLEVAYRNRPDSLVTVRSLRTATAQWERQLEGVTQSAQRNGERIVVDGGELLVANQTLNGILTGLMTLRANEDRIIGRNAETTAQHLATERTGLAIAATAAVVFLIYGFFASHRAALSRERVRIVAEEAEARFREYFEQHPLAMLIHDVRTLRVLAVNDAACQQYGYTRSEFERLAATAIVAPELVLKLQERLKSFVEMPTGSGSAGVVPHIRRDGTQLFAQVTYHLLRYGRHDACFITAIDVTGHEQAKDALQQSNRMLETVLDSVPHRIFWKDAALRYVGCNQAFADDAGIANVDAVAGLTDHDMPWHENAPETRMLDEQVLATGKVLRYEERRTLGDQRGHWLRKTKTPLRDSHGRTTGVLTCYDDISDQKDAELALRLRSRALDAIVNAVLITEPGPSGNMIRYANPAFERITGYAWGDVVGCDCRFLQNDDRDQTGIAEIRRALVAEREVTTLVRNYRKDGSLFWNQLYIAPVRDEHGVVTHHISVVNDVTELVQSRDQLHTQAHYDALTSLPNRTMLHDRLDAALVERRAGPHAETELAVLFMDVDHFKDVNDSLGHSAGDRLLRDVAQRLVGCIGPRDMLARYGGDEFVMLISDAGGRGMDRRVDDVLARIRNELDDPFRIDGIELHVESSVGVAMFPRDGRDAETLLKNADFAMYRAKTNGRNGVHRFEPALAYAAEERIAMSRRMRLALRNGEFHLYYQPQIDLRSGTVTGVEALLRWIDPELGSISPALFIPVAEENGLISALGEWVLYEACTQAKAWESTFPQLRMSVNVSARQFGGGDFCDVVRRVLKHTALNPERLELEITESALVAHGAIDALHALRDIGVGIAIDDFGTGYSSLAYIRNFKADRLKVDISFVRGIGKSRADEAIIRAILALARTLDFTVVAEGVETPEQIEFLVAHRCNLIQGYYFAKPMPGEQAQVFISHFEQHTPARPPVKTLART